jgi:trimethylamine--corrinoid protein Co-methyltransferase
LIEQILSEAREILCTLGVEIHNDNVAALLSDHGATVDVRKKRVMFSQQMIDRALAAAPRSCKLYDVLGEQTHDLSGENVYFTPGSAAINILDYQSGAMRAPTTNDYVSYVKLLSSLGNITSQSTAFIPADVPERISDSYRLFLSLLYGEKPIVTGAFTAQNLLDCAKYAIPVEYISMPLAGFMAPVTLVGTLVQHTAETLSGVVISQLANPGTPVLYGGSPAVFDVRCETTPMGAVETQMIDCAYCEIGKHLGLPTQAYISLSDAKQLDAQAGLETSMGATLAALAGINSISGPGMLDFESCQSLEKLVLDNEICGMTLRLIAGIEPKEDFPALPRFEELLKEGHLLISKHSRRYLREEHYLPGPTIDRANRARWQAEGNLTLGERAHREVTRLIETYEPSRLPESVKVELTQLMENEARRHGMDALPAREE